MEFKSFYYYEKAVFTKSLEEAWLLQKKEKSMKTFTTEQLQERQVNKEGTFE